MFTRCPNFSALCLFPGHIFIFPFVVASHWAGMCSLIVVTMFELPVYVAGMAIFNVKTTGVAIIPVIEPLDVVWWRGILADWHAIVLARIV